MFGKTVLCAGLMAYTANAAAGEFDYNDLGASWGEVAALCEYGKEQSPINLSKSGVEWSDKMQLNGFGYKDYPSGKFAERSDHTIVVNGVADGEFELNFFDGSQSVFKPLQFHLHAPSEHTVNGKNYDLELHVVHLYKGSGGLGAVIGIFFDREAGGNYDNDFIESLKFGETTKGGKLALENVNLASLLGSVDMRAYWNYRGSLTTPPCTEGIKWTVIEQVQPISDAQLEAFTQYFSGDAEYAGGNGNNREIMPLNDRTLYYSIGGAAKLMSGLTGLALAASLSLF